MGKEFSMCEELVKASDVSHYVYNSINSSIFSKSVQVVFAMLDISESMCRLERIARIQRIGEKCTRYIHCKRSVDHKEYSSRCCKRVRRDTD